MHFLPPTAHIACSSKFFQILEVFFAIFSHFFFFPLLLYANAFNFVFFFRRWKNVHSFFFFFFWCKWKFHKIKRILQQRGMKPLKCLPTRFPQNGEGKQNTQFVLEVYVPPLLKDPRNDCSRGEHGE